MYASCSTVANGDAQTLADAKAYADAVAAAATPAAQGTVDAIIADPVALAALATALSAITPDAFEA
jgi:ABC-type uncharacterized transport system substrate-binding protein